MTVFNPAPYELALRRPRKVVARREFEALPCEPLLEALARREHAARGIALWALRRFYADDPGHGTCA